MFLVSWARELLDSLGLVAGSLDSWSFGRAFGGGFGSFKWFEESSEAAVSERFAGVLEHFWRLLGGSRPARLRNLHFSNSGFEILYFRLQPGTGQPVSEILIF